MKHFMKPLAMFAVMLMQISVASSGDDVQLGLYGHAGYNIHSASFTALPNIPCCSPGFDGGGGLGWDVGIMARLPLSNTWYADLRVGYMALSGTMTTDEARTVNLNGEAVSGTIQHSLSATLPSVRIDLLAGYRITQRFSLMFGPTFGILIGGDVEQRETLVAPSEGTFENGTRERLAANVPLPDRATFLPMATFGMSYDIPLDKKERWTLSPEIVASFNFSDITSAVSWTVQPLRGGVTLLYAMGSDEPSPVYASTMPGAVTARINAVGLERDGREIPTVVIRVEEFLGSSCKPLLPYVFFDAGSYVLPTRYVQRSPGTIGTFTENSLHQASMLDTYHQILDIVGSRMREFPASSLTLTGCISEDKVETTGTDLAQQRALVLRNYLVSAWGIDASRIVMQNRGLPAVASNVRDGDGIEENRRVEITSSDPRILDPVWTTDTIRTVTPPALRFYPSATAERGMASWTVLAEQDGRQIKQLDGNGQPPNRVDWNLQDDQAHIPRLASVVDYRLIARDVDGVNAQSDVGHIGVNLRTITKKRAERVKDKVIDRYAIIGFDFSSDKIQDGNARFIERIRQKIAIASTINIVGSTDRMGDEQLNMDLSQRRARAVAKALNSSSINVDAVGESAPVHTNDLPEGRFYNRTVTLVVETPINL